MDTLLRRIDWRKPCISDRYTSTALLRQYTVGNIDDGEHGLFRQMPLTPDEIRTIRFFTPKPQTCTLRLFSVLSDVYGFSHTVIESTKHDIKSRR